MFHNKKKNLPEMNHIFPISHYRYLWKFPVPDFDISDAWNSTTIFPFLSYDISIESLIELSISKLKWVNV